jgi:hypothetical protein
MSELHKYPRTRHVQGSRLQAGDEDLGDVSFSELVGRHLVVEEKVDGANAGVSFGPGGLQLQSRGHFLTGGPRERHFALLKTWATTHHVDLHDVLGERYVMYGEWLYARHTVFYDALPHYFLEFDLLDRETGRFLSTAARRRVLEGAPVVSVPVVHEGPLASADALRALIRPSLYKSPRWRESLREAAATGENGQWGTVERAVSETDPSDLAEGLYVKDEENGEVVARYKWVRATFLDVVAGSGGHWLTRPIVANRLADGVELF